MQHVIVGTAGHIDHGKTSLVKRLTGIDTDRLPEEKARGITIDLGFAHWSAGEFEFGVVDVPGHERFIRNMVAGATGVDLALLVVAADDGVMPQTLEHLEIMDLLGISAGVVAVTKIDLVEPGFVELVIAEIRERTRGTFLEDCPVIPVSSNTGTGIEQLQQALADVARQHVWPSQGELFRMPIDRVFSVAGHGTVVTGTVLGGEVRAGDMLELMPQREPVRVRSVQNHGRQSAASGARQRTAINLACVKTEELHRGQELTTPGYLQPAQRLLVRLQNLTRSPVTLRDRMSFDLHLATTEVTARLILKGQTLEPGQQGYGELRLRQSIVAAYGQRFILRRPSPALTVAGGVILDPGIEPRRRIPDIVARGTTLDAANEAQRLSLVLEEIDDDGISPLFAAWKTSLPPSRFNQTHEALIARGELIGVKGHEAQRFIHRRRLEKLCQLVRKRIHGELARQQPRRALPRRVLIAACQNLGALQWVDLAFDHLLKTGELVTVGPNIGPADAQPKLTKNQIATRAKILELIAAGNLAPPNVKELAAALNQKPDAVQALLNLSVEDGLLVDIGEGLFYSPSAIDEARSICRRTFVKLGSATLSQLREAWGITRKHAVPLCEFFDALQYTIRQGDLRSAGPQL